MEVLRITPDIIRNASMQDALCIPRPKVPDSMQSVPLAMHSIDAVSPLAALCIPRAVELAVEAAGSP